MKAKTHTTLKFYPVMFGSCKLTRNIAQQCFRFFYGYFSCTIITAHCLNAYYFCSYHKYWYHTSSFSTWVLAFLTLEFLWDNKAYFQGPSFLYTDSDKIQFSIFCYIYISCTNVPIYVSMYLSSIYGCMLVSILPYFYIDLIYLYAYHLYFKFTHLYQSIYLSPMCMHINHQSIIYITTYTCHLSGTIKFPKWIIKERYYMGKSYQTSPMEGIFGLNLWNN